MEPWEHVTVSKPTDFYELSWGSPLRLAQNLGETSQRKSQLHAVVPMLKVLESQQQPLEFVLPRKRPLHSVP